MKKQYKIITRIILFSFFLLLLLSCLNNKKNKVNLFVDEYISTVSECVNIDVA